jgi:hypothetical protein
VVFYHLWEAIQKRDEPYKVSTSRAPSELTLTLSSGIAITGLYTGNVDVLVSILRPS